VVGGACFVALLLCFCAADGHDVLYLQTRTILFHTLSYSQLICTDVSCC
jgi:hypothetical protein